MLGLVRGVILFQHLKRRVPPRKIPPRQENAKLRDIENWHVKKLKGEIEVGSPLTTQGAKRIPSGKSYQGAWTTD